MSADQYHNGSADTRSYSVPIDGNPGLYEGTSSESSASSPLNCSGFDNLYGGNGYLSYPTFPYTYQGNGESLASMGFIPVELDIDGLYDDRDRRRRKNGNQKVVASHVHSRRRAQNRASQRAFRDRKEQRMRELEQQLGQLKGRHSDLSRSYESLQVEYASVKQELDKLRKENERFEKSSSTVSGFPGEPAWKEPKDGNLDPLLFDVSEFCVDQEEGESHKG